MAQAQAQRTTTQFVTREQSLSLTKNMLKVSLSEVCFIRNIFPSDAFETINFGGTDVRMLRKKDSTEAQPADSLPAEEVVKLQELEEAAFDALSKGYLKSIVFGIYQPEEGSGETKLLESYVFHVKYPSDKDIEVTLSGDKSSFTMPRVKDEAVTLVRALIRLAETLPRPVPEDRLVNLTLFYYDDRTPADYQPPGFVDASHEALPSMDSPMRMTLGRVSTKHHSVTLKVAASCDDADGESMMRDMSQAKVKGQGEGRGAGDEDRAAAGAGAGSQAPTAYSQAAASKPSSASAPAPAPAASQAVPVVPSVPEDIHPQAYALCRTAVAQAGKVSLKFILDTLAAAGQDVGNEQGKRLVRALEAEGLIVHRGPVSSFRFEVVQEAAAVIVAQAEASKATASATPAKAPTAAAAGSGPSPAASTAGASPSGGASSGLDAEQAAAKLNARLWFTSGIVSVLGKASTRPFVTLAELQADAGCTEGRFTERLARKLEKDGFLLPPGANGAHANKGRRVVVNKDTPRLLKMAVDQLITLGAPVPAYATAALSAFKSVSSSSASPPAAVPSTLAAVAGTTPGKDSAKAGSKRKAELVEADATASSAPAGGSALKKPRTADSVPSASKGSVTFAATSIVHPAPVLPPPSPATTMQWAGAGSAVKAVPRPADAAKADASWDEVMADDVGQLPSASTSTSATSSTAAPAQGAGTGTGKGKAKAAPTPAKGSAQAAQQAGVPGGSAGKNKKASART